MITEGEVIRYSPAKTDLSTTWFCNNIRPCVEHLFLSCLGFDFKAQIESHIMDHGDLDEWDDKKEYAVGDKVEYCGECFEMIKVREVVETDSEDWNEATAATPTPDCDKKHWKQCDKFDNKCFNDLWVYLRDYLAYAVYYETAPEIHIQMGPSGFIVQANDSMGGEGNKKDWFDVIMRTIKMKRDKRLELLKDYIKRKHECGDCDFSKSTWVQSVCGTNACNTQARPGRRIAWKH